MWRQHLGGNNTTVYMDDPMWLNNEVLLTPGHELEEIMMML